MTQEQFERERLPANFTAKITAFFDAARSDDAEAAARLVDQHPALVHRRYAHRNGPWREGTWAALEEGETAGDTALHFAAFHGYTALAGAMLDRGAGIDALDHDGKSPLELAAWEGGTEVLR